MGLGVIFFHFVLFHENEMKTSFSQRLIFAFNESIFHKNFIHLLCEDLVIYQFEQLDTDARQRFKAL